jgi:transporter family-2 protein
MTLISILLAFLGGTFLTLQVGVNAQLRLLIGHPIYATFISFCIGTLYLFVASLTVHTPWPSFGRFLQIPWWAWTGGVLGATYLWFAVLVAPRLGATVLVGLIVAGQLAASLLLDHYGLLGFPLHPINPYRALGAILLVSGVILIRQF